MKKKYVDPFGFSKAINWDKLDDPKVLKQLEELYKEEESQKEIQKVRYDNKRRREEGWKKDTIGK